MTPYRRCASHRLIRVISKGPFARSERNSPAMSASKLRRHSKSRWKGNRESYIRSPRTKPIESRPKRSAMLFNMRMRVGSKWRSATTNFNSNPYTRQRNRHRSGGVEGTGDALGTMACAACASVPNLSAANWISGASLLPEPRYCWLFRHTRLIWILCAAPGGRRLYPERSQGRR